MWKTLDQVLEIGEEKCFEIVTREGNGHGNVFKIFSKTK